MRMKESAGRFIRLLKRQWILIWMIVAMAGLTATVVYAVYTEGNFKIKRVIAPAAEIGGLFTSNYLTISGGAKSVYYQEDATTLTPFTVEIRNFNPNDPDTKYPGTINYSIIASLAHINGDEYTNDDPSQITADSDWIKKNMAVTLSLGDKNISLSGNTLSGNLGITNVEDKFSLTGTHSSDSWTVTLSNFSLNTDYCLKITAIPDNQDLESISQVLVVNAIPKIYTEGWSCALADTISEKNVSNYDAFNYTITGTGNKTLKFSYDSSKLEINPTFCSYITEATSGGYSGSSEETRTGWKTVTIIADPDSTLVNRYDLQLYKVNGYQPEGFDELKPYDLSNPDNNADRDSEAEIYIEFEEAAPT